MNNEDRMYRKRTRRHEGRAVTGVFLLIIGGILLVAKMGFPVPQWLFSWEMMLIVIGLFIGIKHRFKNQGWLIIVFIGAAFLIADAYPMWNLRNYIWPVALIIMGLLFILRPNRKPSIQYSEEEYSQFSPSEIASLDNKIDITAIFSGVKRRVLSKSFLGGDITAFMGGAEIDLTQADIQSTTTMDITAVFGGIKLIVPPDWDVQSHATALFGGVEDKRYAHPAAQNGKVLVLDGVAVFGGIEIRSYPSAT